ncbi:MAG: hypothetical protein FI737_02940 [SAR202 cluster bacterium]|nr:hypothetical protein [SAR202 cluster bacterium]
MQKNELHWLILTEMIFIITNIDNNDVKVFGYRLIFYLKKAGFQAEIGVYKAISENGRGKEKSAGKTGAFL